MREHSRPHAGQYVFAYHVRIENVGPQAAQLLARRWVITDSAGEVSEVEGEGVVGEQPVLEPGEAFEYTSGTPLETPSGIMTGLYHMVTLPAGEAFDVAIPTFSLDSPHGGSQVH